MINVYRGWDISRREKWGFQASKYYDVYENYVILVAETIDDLRRMIDKEEYERARNDRAIL